MIPTRLKIREGGRNNNGYWFELERTEAKPGQDAGKDEENSVIVECKTEAKRDDLPELWPLWLHQNTKGMHLLDCTEMDWYLSFLLLLHPLHMHLYSNTKRRVYLRLSGV